MIKLFVIIHLIISNCCIGVFANNSCQLTGTQGKQSPDILSLVKDQSGFSGIIEIVETSSSTNSKPFTNQLKDFYDSSQQLGKIEWIDSVEVSAIKTIYYYSSLLESFVINNGSKSCTTKGLTAEDKASFLYDWMSPKMRNDFDLLSSLLAVNDDQNRYLGPTVLMIMASTLSASSGYYQGQVKLDEFTVDQWSMCLSSDSDLIVDAYFLSYSNLPYRLVISRRFSSSKAKTLINFLSFDPVLPKTDKILNMPIGYGCQRTYKYDNPFWATTSSYLIDMEAAISFKQPDQLKLSTIKLIKHQNTYSYQISQGDSNLTRIIKTPSLLQYFQVNPRTGFCSIEHEKSFYALLSKTVTTQWPLLEDDHIKYNLLSPLLFNLDGANFLGAVKTDFGTMHVFEKIVDSFYTNSANEQINCLVQFYFPDELTHDRHEPPHHLIIRPFSSSIDDDVFLSSVPSRIEITYIDYQTGDESDYSLIDSIDFADAFDVSGCYDEPGQYTWFQLVFPDTTLDIARYQDKDSVIYHSFLTLIEPLIPLLRLPDIRVTIFGPNIYITCKLLQAETFNFISSQSTVLANPTRLIVREYMEDCSELCLDSEYCSAFAHCANMECFLFTNSGADGSTYKTEYRDGCTFYVSSTIDNLYLKSQVEINLLKSSKNILHQLKRKLDQGQLVLPNLQLSAGDLFIINSPDEIGGVDEEVSFGQLMDVSSMGDDFDVLIPNQRFTNGAKTVGLDYQSCLSLCANDNDCYTLSYCPAPASECIIMNKTADQVQSDYKQLSSYIDGCDILSKSFLSFYRKLPGRSLILDAMVTIPNVPPAECARHCSLETDFDCQSFDYCPQVENNQDKITESACFLHTFHVATDSAHQMDGNIWDFSTAECDHYSRKLSKDYQHLIGLKLRSNVRIINEKKGVSLENCAYQCNDQNRHCSTFEFCESIESFTSTCRLTNYIPSGSNDDNLDSTSFLSSSSSLCSVYVNRKSKSISGQYDDEVEGGLGIAVALGAFFFISAFAIGTIASHLYIRRFS